MDRKQQERILELIQSDEWPKAVPDHLLVDERSERAKRERARATIDLAGLNVTEQKVLDFGCGQGHVTLEAAGTAALSVGFDIEGQWDDSGNGYVLTTDFSEVDKHRYDVVFLYDVIDHLLEGESPRSVLSAIRGVLADGGRVFVRCHPWFARHGGHLYSQLNKAYIHVFVHDQDDVRELLGLRPEPVRRYSPASGGNPLTAYDGMFQQVGYRIVEKQVVKFDLDRYFLDTSECRAWLAGGSLELIGSRVNFQETYSIEFVDYVLGR